MDRTTLETEWARSQVEAMADRSLTGADLARMERLLEADPSLRAELTEAEDVLSSLRAARLPAPPRGLLWRLWSQAPAAAGPKTGRAGLWSGVPAMSAGVFATAAIVFLFGTLVQRMPDPRQQAAIQDFAVAMNYLQRTAILARDEVGQQVGQGLATALSVSASTLAEDNQDNDTNGG